MPRFKLSIRQNNYLPSVTLSLNSYNFPHLRSYKRRRRFPRILLPKQLSFNLFVSLSATIIVLNQLSFNLFAYSTSLNQSLELPLTPPSLPRFPHVTTYNSSFPTLPPSRLLPTSLPLYHPSQIIDLCRGEGGGAFLTARGPSLEGEESSRGVYFRLRIEEHRWNEGCVHRRQRHISDLCTHRMESCPSAQQISKNFFFLSFQVSTFSNLVYFSNLIIVVPVISQNFLGLRPCLR